MFFWLCLLSRGRGLWSCAAGAAPPSGEGPSQGQEAAGPHGVSGIWPSRAVWEEALLPPPRVMPFPFPRKSTCSPVTLRKVFGVFVCWFVLFSVPRQILINPQMGSLSSALTKGRGAGGIPDKINPVSLLRGGHILSLLFFSVSQSLAS